MTDTSKKSKAKKKRCADCKWVDTSKGAANFYCTSPSAFSDRQAKTPPFFPRVLSNDKCIYFEPSEDELKKE